ncbi:transcriptional regulator with XRE-family HTH domain [Saccharopolyspora phatthalungensis]|uniref:Transcriptional regulator with XRE-family HTH domain n=2 Tax=Saccharopolyspora phatthalungensis TaxID=664693 RepID=A0A840Q6K1_9PSEU|nr:transcriptional regulator with XRE-family HTH domain [Saccharopolyspora phatthalungensis]
MATRRTAVIQRRTARGFTQESLAEFLQVERSTVGRWERGLVQPQPWQRPGLASALDVSPAELEELLPLSSDHQPDEQQRRSEAADAAPVALPALSTTAINHEQAPGIAALRRLVDVYDLPTDGPTRPLPELRREAEAIVKARLNSDYTKLLRKLPDLVPELTRALFLHDGLERTNAARLLIQAYRAADAIADKFGFYDLSGRIIGVMRWAAELSEDPLAVAATRYVRAETFFANGQLAAGRLMSSG